MMPRALFAVVVCALMAPGLRFPGSVAAAADAPPPAGVVATFSSGSVTDATVLPQLSLHVPAGQAATPFLPAGPFTSVWEGTLSVDLRAEYLFEAEARGRVSMSLNGKPVLNFTSPGGTSPLSAAVPLRKGTNSLRIEFASPESGDAWLRVNWTEKGPFTVPVPRNALAHGTSVALEKGDQLRLGRALVIEHHCTACHAGPSAAESIPELRADAPTFAGIGARRRAGWLEQWILNPHAMRSNAMMPRLLHGPSAAADASAIAGYLASLKTGGEVKLPTVTPSAAPAAAAGEGADQAAHEEKTLFEKLHCAACHQDPAATERDPSKLSLRHVAAKFPEGRLAEFLRLPEAHYAWTRMPNFRLSAAEASELAAWLLQHAGPAGTDPAPAAGAAVERGRELVETVGCLQCHTAGAGPSRSRAPSLAAVAAPGFAPAGGLACLATPGAAPGRYAFNAAEVAAIRTFLKAETAVNWASLKRHVPAEYVARQSRQLNCTGCHGQFDGFPGYELLGGKLRPEWAARFIAGEIPRKMRAERHPKGERWLDARMPAFASRGALLAAGMAHEHGYPGRTAPEGPVDLELAKAGHKLTGKDGGLSCVSCHGVNDLAALEVFEVEGINLGWSAERLLKPYYQRWMRSPLSVDPQTKMPTYFEDGRSQLGDVLGGDAEKQIEALWQYMRQADRMPKPAVEPAP